MAINSQKVLGIIFPNMHDEQLGEVAKNRTTASVLFGGRYRLIDFNLSMFVAAGIDDILMPVRKNYISLMDHIGSGKEWDLSRKIGGVKIYPPYAWQNEGYYKGRLGAIKALLKTIKDTNCESVVLSDCAVVCNIDLKDVLKEHKESDCDITVVYRKEKLTDEVKAHNVTFEIENGCVEAVLINDDSEKEVNNSMWLYVIKKDILVEMVADAAKRGFSEFEVDILQRNLDKFTVCAYEYKGLSYRLTGLKSYFEANLAMLKPENLKSLFSKYPIYTKIRDDAPVRYSVDSLVKNSIVADGCVVEGEVKGSVLFKGVKIHKDAKVKNCVLMQDTVIESGAVVENIITDKGVTITKDSKLMGNCKAPLFLSKNSVI